MIPLLLLLTLAPQADSAHTLYVLATVPLDTVSGVARISAIVNAHKARLLLVLKAYEQDCYNDSTMPRPVSYYNGSVWWEDTLWTHREPTFTGFIIWLEEK